MGTPQADATRFAETVKPVIGSENSAIWTFGQCLLFHLKLIVPLYGLLVLISALIGNPHKYPPQVTRFMRASLIFNILTLLVLTLIAFAVAPGILSEAVQQAIAAGGAM